MSLQVQSILSQKVEPSSITRTLNSHKTLPFSKPCTIPTLYSHINPALTKIMWGQEAAGSRSRKTAVAPEGAEADALAEDDEVARPHVIVVRARFM